MGLLERFGFRKKRPDEGKPRAIRARFDAAQTNPENSRHWSNADALAADSALDPTTRAILRNRSRYECANNSYAAGIVRTLGQDAIGTGPLLQLSGPDRRANKMVESAWHRWCDAIDLPGKLRTMRMAKARDGESFGIITNNQRLRDAGLPSLDLHLIEADQVYAPFGSDVQSDGDRRNVDGIVVDGIGRPIGYTIAELHPGSSLGGLGRLGKFRSYEASQVIHYYSLERPGQHRGVPELTPALPLFAQLRRYTLAVLSAAELAATFAGVEAGEGRTISSLYRNSGIVARGSVVLGDPGPEAYAQTFFPPPSPGAADGPTTAARMLRYAEEAGPLALAAAGRALESAAIDAASVTHLVTCSCTGFASPGVDVGLVAGLGLPPTIARTHVGFMGCHGAFNALRVAEAFVAARPASVPLVG